MISASTSHSTAPTVRSIHLGGAPYDPNGPVVARRIQDAVDLPDMLGHLRDLNGPRVVGTTQARAAAELIQAKVKAIGGWDVTIENSGMGEGSESVPLHNVVATKRGTAPDAERGIVVGGAHFDTVRGSPGANDDGTGVVALLETAEALRDIPTRNDVRLVWFDGEEAGLLGSKAYVRQHAADGPRTVGMIQAEMLASPQGAPVMLFGGKTPVGAGQPVTESARQLGIQLEVSKDRPWGSDHNPFSDVGIPSMVVSTTAPPPRRIMHDDPGYHSSGDTIEHLNTAHLSGMADLIATSIHRYATEPARLPQTP